MPNKLNPYEDRISKIRTQPLNCEEKVNSGRIEVLARTALALGVLSTALSIGLIAYILKQLYRRNLK